MSPASTPIHIAALPPSPPLSPKYLYPLVDRLLRILRLYRAGTLPDPETYAYRTFHLPPHHFAELQRRLEDEEKDLGEWWKSKGHWDYDGVGRYTLRMPTRIHERFTALVDEEIYNSIKALCTSDSALKCLEDVYQGRSTTIALHAPRLENSSQSSDPDHDEDVIIHRSPDATFYHRARDALPMLVVEVSYSQRRKDLPRLAESYIVDGRHEVRCVIGLDIVYGGKSGKSGKRDRTATVSVWRPGVEVDEEGEGVGVCECVVDGVAFRGRDGGLGDGELVIGLGDLVPEEVLDGMEGIGEKCIKISFSRLAAFLEDAEGQGNTPSTETKTPIAPKKFRKRKRSPSEELSDGREAAYLKLEEADLEKERHVDTEWKGAGWAKQEGAVEVVERRRSKRSKSGRAVGEAS